MSFGTQFLADVARFPARIAGCPCGTHSFPLYIGDTTFRFNGLSHDQFRALEIWAERACCHKPSDIRSLSLDAKVFRADADEFCAVDFGGKDYFYDRDYQFDSIRFCGWNFMCLLRCRPHLTIGIWVRPDDDLIRYGVFENILRLLVAYQLVGCRGILLHSAAVIASNGAHVLFGPSGAGKSTISRLSLAQGYDVISDDLNVLRIRDGGLVCQSIPFSGDLGGRANCRGEWPVKRLYRLRKGDRHEVHGLSPAGAFAGLLACSPFINSDPYRLGDLWHNLEDVMSLVPVSELMFRRDSGFLDLLCS